MRLDNIFWRSEFLEILLLLLFNPFVPLLPLLPLLLLPLLMSFGTDSNDRRASLAAMLDDVVAVLEEVEGECCLVFGNPEREEKARRQDGTGSFP